MTKEGIIKLYKALTLNNKIDNVKFNYWVNKNIKSIENEIEILRKLEEDNDNILSNYNKERYSLFEKYGEKVDEKIVISNDNIVNFQNEIILLEDKYKDDIDLFNESEKQRFEILKENVDIDLFKIKYDLLPSNLNNTDEIDSLYILMDIID